jgi:hypothetical protein
MKIPKALVRSLLGAGLLAGAPVFAGSYTNNFDPTQGTDLTFGGNTVLTAYLTNQPQNCVVLSDNNLQEQASITTPDFDNSQAIESFTATFQLELGPGTSPPADGVAFSFGPDVYAGAIYSETGATGPQDLVIWFHTWNNGPSTVGGVTYPVNAPAVNINFGGNQIGLVPIPMAEMVDSQFHNVSIQLTRAGKVSVVYLGQIIYTNFFIDGWAPTAGLFNINGRCGGSSEWAEVAQLSINTVLQGTAVAPTILSNPVNATVNEEGTTNFTVAVDGTAPFSFQWVDNGTDIPGATDSTLTMGPIPYTENNHQIKVRVSNPANTTGVTSGAAILTVIRDTTPPTVVKANADTSGTLVTVVYSKAVSDTALDSANYSINQNVTIYGITRMSATTVTLQTSPMPGGLSYTLSIHGVQDTASSPPNTIAPTQVTFNTYMFQVGAVLHKKYTDPTPTSGTTLTTLQADPRYPNNPDRQDIMTMFEYPAGGNYRDATADPGGGGAVTYSDTLECFFIPPTTNDYVFFAAGADLNDVWLSTDTDPANIVHIAQESGWTNPRGWLQYDPLQSTFCGSTNGQRSDWYTGNTDWPGVGDATTGNAFIHLDGGQRYYMLAFHHRDTWSGADDFAVTYAYAGAPPPAIGDAPLLTSSVVATYLDPTGASVTFTQQPTPTNATILDARTVTFTCLATGQSLYGTTVTYQWQSAPKGSSTFTDITGATLNTYTTPPLHDADSGIQFRVYAIVAGLKQASSVVTVTVIPDTVAPTVLSANPDVTGTHVTVVYSQGVSDTALTLSNYGIDQGVTISAITRLDDSRVVLTTSQMAGGATAYTLSIHGVQDLAIPANTMVPTQVTFKTYTLQVGAILHKKYNGLTDSQGNLASLKSDPRYPNYPDRQETVATFEYPANAGGWDRVADPTFNYSDTLECFFIPPTTNDYVFWAGGCDICDVYLSTDADPAHMVNIAQMPGGWTDARGWNVEPLPCGNNTNGLRSDWYEPLASAGQPGNQWPGAGDPTTGQAFIHLDGGKQYYLLAFHHTFSWSGGNYLDATYSYAGGPLPAYGDAPLLTGSVVGTLLDPTGASITFNPQPADVTILQGRTATLTTVVTGQSLYGTNAVLQWQTAPSGSTTFTNIPGATTSSYTTPVLGLADTGRQYQLVATVPGLTQASRVATVTVNKDTIPPNLVAASALASRSNATFDVGVTFDEPLDPTTAGTLANYTLSAGTPTAVQYYAGSPGVVLTVSGLTVGQSYSVTVANVADLYGNHMTSANLPFTVSSMQWGVVGADELSLGNGVVAVAPNAFDIYSDGIAEWGSYDEATFVYEQVTGDFDKELRVEYVDPASEWARAGLIVRDVTNFGVNRAAQTGSGSTTPPWDGVAGRYQKVHVQPVITAMGTAGANDYECNRRLDTGGPTATAAQGGTPLYPNAWCRLQRVGQTFTFFRSDDGVNWVTMGSTTWGLDDTNKVAMPNTVYVGPEYAPENGNVTPASLQAMFMAKFRDYGNYGVAPPTLAITKNSDGTFTLTYTGTLYSSQTAKGTYAPVSGASTPWTVNPKATSAPATQFYRAQQ